MNRIVIDADLLGRLLNLSQPLEFCTESGLPLGTFMPQPERAAALRAEPILKEEEMQRLAQGEGYTTEEVIAHLESLGCTKSNGNQPPSSEF